MENYQLRETYWTPYEEMKKHIGKKFEIIRPLTVEEIGDEELNGQLFKIRLEDGLEINAWAEEVYEKSCRVNGVLI